MDPPPTKKVKREAQSESITTGHMTGDITLSEECVPSVCAYPPTKSVSDQLLMLEASQCEGLSAIPFSPPFQYNPLAYAKETHTCYVHRYGNSKKHVLFLGMNPGPFGMAQNGVPFGDTSMVKDWLNITGQIDKPHPQHPKRPISGLDCSRNEVSGTRFWGLMRELCTSPQVFFNHCYVHNYCPLCFMTTSGKNVTPVQLKLQERRQLEGVCDRALERVVNVLGVEWIVCVGGYVEIRANKVFKQIDDKSCPCVRVCRILHPSPINPRANKGWAGIVKAQLKELGLLEVITDSVT